MKELRRFLKYLKGYEGQLAIAVTLILAVTALTLPYPLIVRAMLDNALPNHDWDQQRFLIFLFLMFFVTRGIFSYFNRYLLQRVGMRITCDLRKDLFKHLQTLSMKYYENFHTGKIVARVAEDTGALFNLVT